jgi:hypothetical protein
MAFPVFKTFVVVIVAVLCYNVRERQAIHAEENSAAK